MFFDGGLLRLCVTGVRHQDFGDETKTDLKPRFLKEDTIHYRAKSYFKYVVTSSRGIQFKN